jgi:dCMP deaminase
MKPRDVPDRDSFYIAMAFWAASRSKDPSSQCGAFIIGENNEPLGWGYNGPPKKIKDTDITWTRPEKYDFIVHSEVNAIQHAHGNLENSTMYVTAKPCKSCMLHIVSSGIGRVVYFPFRPKDKSSMLCNVEISEKTDKIAQLGNVVLEEFNQNLDWMLERINWMKSEGIFEQIRV